MSKAGFYSFPLRTGTWEFDGKGHAREVEPEPFDPVVDPFLKAWEGDGVEIRIRFAFPGSPANDC